MPPKFKTKAALWKFLHDKAREEYLNSEHFIGWEGKSKAKSRSKSHSKKAKSKSSKSKAKSHSKRAKSRSKAHSKRSVYADNSKRARSYIKKHGSITRDARDEIYAHLRSVDKKIGERELKSFIKKATTAFPFTRGQAPKFVKRVTDNKTTYGITQNGRIYKINQRSTVSVAAKKVPKRIVERLKKLKPHTKAKSKSKTPKAKASSKAVKKKSKSPLKAAKRKSKSPKAKAKSPLKLKSAKAKNIYKVVEEILQD